jgi:hypothetical protein
MLIGPCAETTVGAATAAVAPAAAVARKRRRLVLVFSSLRFVMMLPCLIIVRFYGSIFRCRKDNGLRTTLASENSASTTERNVACGRQKMKEAPASQAQLVVPDRRAAAVTEALHFRRRGPATAQMTGNGEDIEPRFGTIALLRWTADRHLLPAPTPHLAKTSLRRQIYADAEMIESCAAPCG